MKVLASLYSRNSKTGASVVWEFCQTASGQFCATNGWKLQHARDKADLRRMYAKIAAYKTESGAPRFSRVPLIEAGVTA